MCRITLLAIVSHQTPQPGCASAERFCLGSQRTAGQWPQGGVRKSLPNRKGRHVPNHWLRHQRLLHWGDQWSVWGNSPRDTTVSGESTCRLVRKEDSGERKEIQTQQMSNSGKEDPAKALRRKELRGWRQELERKEQGNSRG